ncbi:transposase domain-containing protein [candidate division KSB1 bacterium]|nr:transposase domain-containing protein [candidate division KSB1 bacterium]
MRHDHTESKTNSACCACEHKPFVYLRGTLNRMPDHPINKIAELLPQNWRTPTS